MFVYLCRLFTELFNVCFDVCLFFEVSTNVFLVFVLSFVYFLCFPRSFVFSYESACHQNHILCVPACLKLKCSVLIELGVITLQCNYGYFNAALTQEPQGRL